MQSTSVNGKRSTVGRTAVVSVLAAGLLLGGGTVAANAATPTPTPSTSSTASAAPSPSPSREGLGARFFAHPAAHAVLRFFIKGDSSKTGYGERAAKLAGFILDKRPHWADRLPEALQADLKTLRDAAKDDQTAVATKIKESALNGGYGERIQKAAQKLQASGS
ncbi:hypothetical protein [Paenarthrobacter sp. NPDC090522]|uniref:hypothetical protein n=1 Tax=Paenarthrobacter sp. NPDC090522 TaxID=3364383 RepID=UPI0037FB4ACF